MEQFSDHDIKENEAGKTKIDIEGNDRFEQNC